MNCECCGREFEPRAFQGGSKKKYCTDGCQIFAQSKRQRALLSNSKRLEPDYDYRRSKEFEKRRDEIQKSPDLMLARSHCQIFPSRRIPMSQREEEMRRDRIRMNSNSWKRDTKNER